VLLDSFFSEVQSKADPQVFVVLVPAMLKRLELVYKVPGYQEAVCRYSDRDAFGITVKKRKRMEYCGSFRIYDAFCGVIIHVGLKYLIGKRHFCCSLYKAR
jgi:hypothetical protein